MIKNSRQHDKDRVFRFLKKYITLSMLSILLFISLMYFVLYSNLEILRITKSSINGLLQLGLSCDSLFDSIKKLDFQIYNDNTIQELVNSTNMDTQTTIKSNTRLRNYTTLNSSIISIYVYSKKTDCFYTTIPSVPKQSRAVFFDREAADYINNIKNIPILYPIARKIKPYSFPDIPDNTINAYTFVYYGPAKLSNGNFNRVVFINILEESVKDFIGLWSRDMDGGICIMNEEGMLVSSLYDEMLKDISYEEFAGQILKHKKENGHFVSNVSGKKSFVTYAYSNRLGWFYIRVIPYSSVFDNLRKISLITIVSIILYIAVGYILSYVITGKAKKSIDDIIDDLKMQIRDNRSELIKLKDAFLFNILVDNMPTSQEQINKKFSEYEIALSIDNMLLLILFKIDHYFDLCAKIKSNDMAILKQAVIKKASEIFSEKYAVEAVDMMDDHIILAFNDTDNTAIAQIDKMIRLVQDSVEKNINLSLSAVLSPSEYTFCDISLLYAEVKQASYYRTFYGHKCIIHAEELQILDADNYIYPAEKEKILLDSLMLGKVEHAGKLLDEIISSTRGYPNTVLDSLLLKLTFSIRNTFERIKNVSKYSIDYNFNSFSAALNMCETIGEIKSCFNNMFKNVFSVLEERKNSKYELLMNKAIDIIKSEFADESLCLNSIAAQLSISSGYLGKLFKTYTSKSVADYINQVRIKNSLKLLEDSRMQINDISAAT